MNRAASVLFKACTAGGGVCFRATPAGRRGFTAALQRPPPLLLILDLDETLVRVACEGVHDSRRLDHVDFWVSVELGLPPQRQAFRCAVARRPGLDAFLEWVKDRRSAGVIEGPWIFTTAVPNFTKAILKEIDPGGHIFAMRVLTRAACTVPKMPGVFLKDLGRVPSALGQGSCQDARRKVLVDNSPISCVLNPDNAVLVRDWLGGDVGDVELERVRFLLDAAVEGAAAQPPCSPEAADYAGRLRELIPRHAGFRVRLQELGTRLDSAVPQEPAQLRAALRMVSAECHDIKRDLLGAAP